MRAPELLRVDVRAALGEVWQVVEKSAAAPHALGLMGDDGHPGSGAG